MTIVANARNASFLPNAIKPEMKRCSALMENQSATWITEKCAFARQDALFTTKIIKSAPISALIKKNKPTTPCQ
jgi:hypothetical protein